MHNNETDGSDYDLTLFKAKLAEYKITTPNQHINFEKLEKQIEQQGDLVDLKEIMKSIIDNPVSSAQSYGCYEESAEISGAIEDSVDC
ncbi:hypothetical protein OAP56_04255 [Rickettsiaceae bacterium]|nr:hypothetical protein [Rickettsiaceae bacterium]